MTSTTTAQRKTPIWAKILLIFFILVLIGAAAVGGLVAGKFFGAKEERDVQVVRSISREEKVILLTAGLTDTIEEVGDGFDVFGLFDLPGSERNMLVRFDFDGKFGIDGKDVKITPTGENAYRITIPQFRFLGYDNPEFSVVSNQNGVLSWTTPEIDKFDVAERVLSEEAVEKHVEGFRPVLEEQAREFYTNIITAIDPDITLEFEFAQ